MHLTVSAARELVPKVKSISSLKNNSYLTSVFPKTYCKLRAEISEIGLVVLVWKLGEVHKSVV